MSHKSVLVISTQGQNKEMKRVMSTQFFIKFIATMGKNRKVVTQVDSAKAISTSLLYNVFLKQFSHYSKPDH